jgi:N-acetylmuramoyl-L-alanine amidase
MIYLLLRNLMMPVWRGLKMAGLLITLLLSVYQTASAKPQIRDIRHWSSPTTTRVVLDVSHKLPFKSFALTAPPRFVVDLEGVRLAEKSSVISVSSELVSKIRLARHSPEKIRLVLDLRQNGLRHKAFLLSPVQGRPYRLVVDVESPALTQRMKEERRTIQRLKPGKTFVIVIDPGHGGEDPGAIGRGKTREKDVVLGISKALLKRLNRLPGVKAFLTRKGDYYISLKKRVEIAKDYDADLFLSIHADGSLSRKPRGASVYCLSLSGATDEAARILAEKENASDVVGGVELNGDPSLNAILLDLVQTQTINDSLKFGGFVLTDLEKVHRLRFQMPRQAGFRVLKAPDIPSILVEVGFISNPKEEHLMKTPAFRARIAESLNLSARRFLCQYSPARQEKPVLGFCDRLEPVVHVVRNGENLSQIASLHQASVREIKRLNKIKDGSRIYPGQKIQIP